MASMGYGKDYKYPHHFPGHFVREQYLPDEIKDRVFYRPSEMGEEKKVKSRLDRWQSGPIDEPGPDKDKANKDSRPSEKYLKKKPAKKRGKK
jgi:hypothetical protein